MHIASKKNVKYKRKYDFPLPPPAGVWVEHQVHISFPINQSGGQRGGDLPYGGCRPWLSNEKVNKNSLIFILVEVLVAGSPVIKSPTTNKNTIRVIWTIKKQIMGLN